MTGGWSVLNLVHCVLHRNRLPGTAVQGPVRAISMDSIFQRAHISSDPSIDAFSALAAVARLVRPQRGLETRFPRSFAHNAPLCARGHERWEPSKSGFQDGKIAFTADFIPKSKKILYKMSCKAIFLYFEAVSGLEIPLY